MNKYHFKEKDYANEILTNGFTSKYIGTELKILAKDYRALGKDETEIKKFLYDFCRLNLKGFNEVIHFKIINSAVTYCMNDKNKLIQIDKINVSSEELKVIENMSIPHDHKRVVFTLLILTKMSKEFVKIKDGEIKSKEYYFGGHKNYRELVSTSKITFNKTKKSTIKNIHDLIHILDEQGIVKITGNGNIKLLFMYNIEEDDGIVLSVNDYSAIGYYYDLYCGENKVKECESCEELYKSNKHNQKYCNGCRILIKQRKDRENKREKYNSRKANKT